MSKQSELDDILDRIYWGDKSSSEIKQALLDWHNRQIEEVLDRLVVEVRASDYIGIAETIQSERNKLKESK